VLAVEERLVEKFPRLADGPLRTPSVRLFGPHRPWRVSLIDRQTRQDRQSSDPFQRGGDSRTERVLCPRRSTGRSLEHESMSLHHELSAAPRPEPMEGLYGWCGRIILLPAKMEKCFVHEFKKDYTFPTPWGFLCPSMPWIASSAWSRLQPTPVAFNKTPEGNLACPLQEPGYCSP